MNATSAEIRATIKWYFESKNMSIRKAIQIRGPLSVEQHNDLRIFYSQYFTSVVSATEALMEKESPFCNEFRDLLFQNFVLDEYTDGEQNYGYLKELRNSIIHRAEDIASRGSMTANGLHLLHALPRVSSRNGKITYSAFSPLILGIILLCESVIGKLILKHFQEHEFLKPVCDRDAWVQAVQSYTQSDPTIPDWVKQQLPKAISQINPNEIELQLISSLIQMLSSVPQELIDVAQEIQLIPKSE